MKKVRIIMHKRKNNPKPYSRAGTSPSSRRAAVQPSAALEPGTVLTEDEKLQREVQNLMADIGEDTRDPEYLKL